MRKKVDTEYNQIPDEYHSFDHNNITLKNEYSNVVEYKVASKNAEELKEDKAKRIKDASTLIALVTGGTTLIVGGVITLSSSQTNSLVNINEITENSVSFSFDIEEKDPDTTYYAYVIKDNTPDNKIYGRLEYNISNSNPDLRMYSCTISNLETSTKYLLTVGKTVNQEDIVLETTSFTTLKHVDNSTFSINISDVTSSTVSFSFTNIDETNNDNYVAYVLANSYSQVAAPNKIYSRITKDVSSTSSIHKYNGLLENLINNTEYTLSIAQIDPSSGEEVVLGSENFTTLEY